MIVLLANNKDVQKRHLRSQLFLVAARDSTTTRWQVVPGRQWCCTCGKGHLIPYRSVVDNYGITTTVRLLWLVHWLILAGFPYIFYLFLCHRILRNLLARLDIRCDNEEHGCTAVVKLDTLARHIKECDYNPKVCLSFLDYVVHIPVKMSKTVPVEVGIAIRRLRPRKGNIIWKSSRRFKGTVSRD
jgi:hypothetical protein